MKEFLKIILWGDEVGRLAWDKRKNRSYFTYNPSFIEKGLDIAPIVAPIKSINSRMPIYGEDSSKFYKLPSFLADSLPDDWGNQLFEYWRTENKISNSDITPLEKLSFIGKRGMGAFEFEPETSFLNPKDKIDIESLIDLAQRIFVERENIKVQQDESLTLQSLIAVGTSVGGRQPKAVIAINYKTKEIRSGQISGLKDFDYCILKFGDPERSSAELEMTYYEMASMAGIKMMESSLIDIDGCKHFLTKRFDRDGENKLHTQTFAAIYPETDSYEKLLWICRKLRLTEKDCEEIFRRMVFNILANNTDDHNKNFSLIMDRNGIWRLSPAYDMTFIFNKGGFLPQNDHCLMIRGKLKNISKQDVIDFAKDNGIRRYNTIINEVAAAITSFNKIADKYNVKEEWKNKIDTCLSKHLSSWDYFEKSENISFKLEQYTFSNIKLEQAYRGNFHLLASINNKEYKYIIRQDTEDYEIINKRGIDNISLDYKKELINKYILPKVNKK